MRTFGVSVGVLVFLLVAGIVGLFNGASGLMLGFMCVGPFVMFTAGWGARAALNGKRIQLVDADQPSSRARGSEGVRRPAQRVEPV